MREFTWDSPPPTPEESRQSIMAGLRSHIKNQKRRIKALHNNLNWIDKEIAKKMEAGMDIYELANSQSNRNAIRKEIKWSYQNIKDTYVRLEEERLNPTIEEYRK